MDQEIASKGKHRVLVLSVNSLIVKHFPCDWWSPTAVRRLWRGFDFYVMFLFDDCRTKNGGLTGIGEGCSDCNVVQASRKHGSHAPPPGRHMTAIHEPGLKEATEIQGSGWSAISAWQLRCCAISPCAKFFLRQSLSPPFPLDYLCGAAPSGTFLMRPSP